MKLLLEWDSNSMILEPGRNFTLGRDNSSDIQIENSRISRTHLRIGFDGKHWRVADLGSSNGTFLNGKEIDVELIGVALGDALDTLATMKGNGNEECPTCVR